MGNDRPDQDEEWTGWQNPMITGGEPDDEIMPDVDVQGLLAYIARQKAGGQPEIDVEKELGLGQPGEKPASQQAERAASQRQARATMLAPYAPMVRLMTLVTEGLPRCHVYFKIVSGPEPTFKIEVLVIAAVDGLYFVQTMRTGDISAGINNTRLGEEANLLIKGIANQLAVASFRGKKDPLPSSAFKMLVEPA
jgi:hypothetical protein